MNNRIMAALFALTLCLCLFIGVVPVDAEAASCGLHQADWFTNYTYGYDNTQHWKVCNDCGEYYGYHAHNQTVLRASTTKHEVGCTVCDYVGAVNHTPDAIEPCKCAACGTVYNHRYNGNKYEHDETDHWQVCDTCGEAKPNSTAAHNFSWSVVTVEGVSMHKGVCGCGYTVTEAHSYTNTEWKENGAGTHHFSVCDVCGDDKALYGEHDIQYADNGDGNHTASCSVCGDLQGVGTHALNKTVNDDGTHTVECTLCDYEVVNEAHMDEDGTCKCDVCYAEMHTYDGWNQHSSGTKHIVGCSVCGKQDPKARWEEHTFEYVSNGDGTHSKVCTICALSVSVEACPVDTDHICNYCGGICSHANIATTHVNGGAATCEANGWVEHYKCNTCGVYILASNGYMVEREDVLTDPKGHEPAAVQDWNDEEHYYKCVRYGKYGCTELFEVEDHDLVYTNNNNGTHNVSCTGCGFKQTNVTCADVPNDGKCECLCGLFIWHHRNDMIRHSGVAATCETAGNYGYFECRECGSTFPLNQTNKDYEYYSVPGDVVIPALGHDWEHQEDISGQHVLQCANCGDRQLFSHIDENGDCCCDVVYSGGRTCGVLIHDHTPVRVDRQAPTCVDDGYEAYWTFSVCGRIFSDYYGNAELTAPVVIPATGEHEYGDWEVEGEEHVRYCEVCGGEDGRGDHVDANYDNRCDTCRYELSLTFVAEVPATCGTSGRKAHYVSSVTGRSYWDEAGTQYISNINDLLIPALAHVDPATGLGPVCRDKGNGQHEYVCTLCSAVTRTVNHTFSGCFCTGCGAANGTHVATTYTAKAATCDQAGHQAYARCSCGKYFDAMGVETTYQALQIAPLGHTWGTAIFNDDAEGEHYALCTNCNARNYGQHTLTTSDPLSGNYHQMTCACGEVKLEMHYDNNGDNVCDDAGCKRNLSGNQPQVNNHDSVTVVTGNPSNTVSTWSWLKNWLTNSTPSNGGGNMESNETSNPGSNNQTGSSNNNSTPPANGGSDNVQGGNQPSDANGVLQYIVSFFNWLFSGFGG